MAIGKLWNFLGSRHGMILIRRLIEHIYSTMPYVD